MVYYNIKHKREGEFNLSMILDENEYLFRNNPYFYSYDDLYGDALIMFNKDNKRYFRTREVKAIRLSRKIVKMFIEEIMNDILLFNEEVVLSDKPFFSLRMDFRKNINSKRYRYLNLKRTNGKFYTLYTRITNKQFFKMGYMYYAKPMSLLRKRISELINQGYIWG